MIYQLVFIFFLLSSLSTLADTHLFIGGGGNRPHEALLDFATVSHDYSKKQNHGVTRILINAWPSTLKKNEYSEGLIEDFKTVGLAEFIRIPDKAPETEAEIEFFLNLLESADALAFTGGSQTTAMQSLSQLKIRQKIISKIKNGLPLWVGSASSALLGELMLTGNVENPSETTTGFNLVPQTIFDTHYERLVYNHHGTATTDRKHRLPEALIKTHTPYGIGIDENALVRFHNFTLAQTYAENNESVYFLKNNAGIIETLTLKKEQSFNLALWKPTPCSYLLHSLE